MWNNDFSQHVINIRLEQKVAPNITCRVPRWNTTMPTAKKCVSIAHAVTAAAAIVTGDARSSSESRCRRSRRPLQGQNNSALAIVNQTTD